MQTQYALDPVGLTQVIAEASGGQTQHYVPGLAQYNATWAYQLADSLGSVRQLSDVNGDITLAQTYDPFGNLLSQEGVGASNFGYTGEQLDESTDLIYLRARYYQPSVGRFINRDLFQGQIMHPSTQNLYVYTLNNPILYNDPSGYCIPGSCPADRKPASPTPTVAPTATLAPTLTFAPTPTSTPSPTATPTSTSTPWFTPTPSSTPTPSRTPSPTPAYMASVSATLAPLQTYQDQDPDCVAHSITFAYNWLAGTNLDTKITVGLAEATFNRWGPEYGPISPGQAVDIIEDLNYLYDFANFSTPSLTAEAKTMTTDELKASLADPDSVIILFMQLDKSIFKGHAVVLAAYDESHVDSSGNPMPWGTLNWWGDPKLGNTDIYWWSDSEFKRNMEGYYITKWDNVVEVRR